MNLGKLLWVGRSFLGGGEPASYRLNRRACLPKFNEGRNPFAPKALGAAPEPAKEKAAVPAAPVEKAPPPYAFKPVHIPKRIAAAAQAAQPAKPAKSGWTMRLNPFRSAPAEEKSPAVQTELSLDAVKVVHNDLADADVEVVPMKSHADAVVAAPVLPPARRAWEYVGENMLKS